MSGWIRSHGCGGPYTSRVWSVKSGEVHVSRNTARKILRTDDTDWSYERER